MKNSEFQTIHAEIEGALGQLTLNRPDRLNAISPLMLREIAAAAHWFDASPDLRVVIVSGAGRAFTAGADLNNSPMTGAADASPRSWMERRETAQLGRRAADALEEMRALTIVKLHGYIVGGGVVLASACDFRIAADDAIFSIPEIDLGIPLTWGAIPRLVRDIGPVMTKELVITCRRFGAPEAKSIGFINRTVPLAQLDNEIDALAKELLAKPSVPSIITKEHVNAVARAVGATSFADVDTLLIAATEEESRAAARSYVERTLRKKTSKPKS